MKEVEQNISVCAKVNLNQVLHDRRLGFVGIRFGTVEQICKQYGITYKQMPGHIEFSAPKLRLQMLIERLHFSKNKYWM